MGDASFDLLSFDEAMFDEPETFTVSPTSITSAELLGLLLIVGGSAPNLVGFYVAAE